MNMKLQSVWLNICEMGQETVQNKHLKMSIDGETSPVWGVQAKRVFLVCLLVG